MALLRALEAFGHLVDELANWREVGGSVQVHVVQGVQVGLDHSIETIDGRVRYVAVEGEAVVALFPHWTNLSSIAKDWNLLVGVVVLQNRANLLDSAEVLVVLEVGDAVQGAGGGLPAVGESEVDGNSQVDLAASHNVLEERAALLEADLEHIQVVLSIV